MEQATPPPVTFEGAEPPDPLYAFPGFAGDGMTLRDWFAGEALPAIISTSLPGLAQDAAGDEELMQEAVDSIVEVAYKFAESMLSRREVYP